MSRGSASAQTMEAEPPDMRYQAEPGNEYNYFCKRSIEGEIIQKPLPKTKHSLLQLRTCNEINQVTETPKIAYAFPELRCTFGGRSLVTDIAVLLWEQIQFDDSIDRF